MVVFFKLSSGECGRNLGYGDTACRDERTLAHELNCLVTSLKLIHPFLPGSLIDRSETAGTDLPQQRLDGKCSPGRFLVLVNNHPLDS
eukprot:scaffold26523_cov108-Cylindrotheca_fusiformis.AAC.3